VKKGNEHLSPYAINPNFFLELLKSVPKLYGLRTICQKFGRMCVLERTKTKNIISYLGAPQSRGATTTQVEYMPKNLKHVYASLAFQDCNMTLEN
jgi:hypothetical protein